MRAGSTPTSSPSSPAEINNLSIFFQHLIKNTVNKLSSSFKKPSRPFVPLTVNKINLTALYDTGADISCMSTKTFRRLFQAGNRPTKIAKDSVTRGATGSSLDSIGRYMIPLKLEERSYLFPFSVFNNLNEDMILGIDFIVKFGLGFDTTDQTLFWADKDNSWANANLVSTKQVVLEPMSNKFVTMNVMTHNNFRIGTPGEAVACIASDKHVIQGGPALVMINKNGQTTMEIFNCSNHQITIERDSMLGVAEKIHQDDKIEEMNVNAL